MEQMAKYYWGMLSATRSAATTSSLRSSWPAPAPIHGSGGGGGEPSWEELAFARDAAGHLGGCVWPPRSYTCTFCRREFRSAQALGGHMNVHRRDRARLRQCASPDHDEAVHADAHNKQQSIDPDPHQLLQLQEYSPLFRAKAVLISGPKSTCDPSTIVKESKNKVVVSIPAVAAESKEAPLEIDDDEEEITVAEPERRPKRRRASNNQQPEAALLPQLFFLRPLAPPSRGVEHAKVPNKVVITSPSTSSSPNSLHLAGRQELDLELRLGTTSPNKVP